MLKHLALSLLIIFAVTQCTVQKRLYNKGYSVSWNRKFQKEKPVEMAEETDEAEPLVSVVDTIVQGNLPDENFTIADDQFSISEDNLILEESTSKAPLADTVYIVSKNVPEGVAAACLLAGSLIGCRVAPLLTPSLIGTAFLACGVLFLASLVLAIVSMIIYRRYRKDYQTNILGKLTFIIDLVIITLVIALAVLLLALFF